MIGILIILSTSWGLVYLIERNHLEVIGIFPKAKRLKKFIVGFIITASLCCLSQLIEVVLGTFRWSLNPDFSALQIVEGLWWNMKSVLTEELIYRGALLYLLIRFLSPKKAMLISASAFGIYHWFSFGVFGNLVPMILIFIGTGLMGYAWALSFYKTKSIYLAFGLHLGWNFTLNSIFSKGPLGDQLLIHRGGEMVGDVVSLINFLISMILIPLIVFIWVKYVVVQEEWETKLNGSE
ncbi:CPBP family glutamic-type intramembrane protease [Ekhidna sp.]|uniref:CPBP family intramembrane glutamic endopeptidase n=1 Tax=Ekhidna sp. TaxID=2608089 RepID=UPI003299B47D